MSNKTINSKEVAKMLNKRHDTILLTIRRRMNKIVYQKIKNFFIQDVYIDDNNRKQPCFRITELGCECIANTMKDINKKEKFIKDYTNYFNIKNNINKNNKINKKIDNKNIINKENINIKKMIYVCSPYNGNTEYNVFKTRMYCNFIMNVEGKGYIPIAPHIYFTQFMNDDSLERDLAMQMNMTLLEKCDEVWVFGYKDILSEGMKQEIEMARKLNKIIKYFYPDVIDIHQYDIEN